MAENLVILQAPKSGEQVAKGSSVDLIISKGKEPQMVTVPDVVGSSLDEAKSSLAQKGLSAVSYTHLDVYKRQGTDIY